MKKIISYTLFTFKNNEGRRFSTYKNILMSSIPITKKLLPDFEIWIYLDDSKKDVAIEFEKLSANIILCKNVDKAEDIRAMLWRYYPIKEGHICISLDTDSFVTNREVYVIREFLKSKKKYLIIRDNQVHDTYILGGLFGVKGRIGNIDSMQVYIAEYLRNNYTSKIFTFGQDQWDFLSNYIYPKVFYRSLIFDNVPNRFKIKVISNLSWKKRFIYWIILKLTFYLHIIHLEKINKVFLKFAQKFLSIIACLDYLSILANHEKTKQIPLKQIPLLDAPSNHPYYFCGCPISRDQISEEHFKLKSE